MTSYSTCAKTGCMNKIAYELTDDTRPLYCEHHISEMDTKIGVLAYRAIQKKSTPAKKPDSQIIMRCTICHKRKTISVSDFEKGMLCQDAPSCHGIMIYHKDAD